MVKHTEQQPAAGPGRQHLERICYSGSVLTNSETPGQNNQSSQVKNESKIVEWNWNHCCNIPTTS